MVTKDLSRGKPLKLLIIFALPMVLSVVFQQLYNICDSVIAGQMLGEQALAAVSVSYPITMIYMGIGTGLSIGCGILISRAYGQKDVTALKSCVSTSFIAVTVIGLVMTFVGWFCARPLLRLLNTPENIFDRAARYLEVYTLGMVFVYIYNACGVAFQSLGNSKVPLFFLIFSTVLNVALDILFLLPEGADISGLSTATVIAQGVAAVGSVLVLCYLLHNVNENGEEATKKRGLFQKAAIIAVSLAKYITLKKPYRLFKTADFVEIIKMGVPNILQMTTVSIGQLFIQGLVNGYGETVIAAYGAGIKISSFLIQIMIAESNAVSIYISQNVGAGTHGRIKDGVRAGTIILVVSTVVVAALGLILAPTLMSLFVSAESTEVIAIGAGMLRIVIPFYFVVIFKFIADALTKGTGAMTGFVLSTLVDLVVRVASAFLFVYLADSYVGIWWSWPAGWVFGTIVALLFAIFGNWRKKIAKYRLPVEAIEGEPAEEI